MTTTETTKNDKILLTALERIASKPARAHCRSFEESTEMTTEQDQTTIRQRALDLYQPPFRHEHGYIFDSTSQMVADDPAEADKAARVRGWGRIQKMADAAKVQDEFGCVLAEALNLFYADRLNVVAGDDHEALTFHELPKEPKPLKVVIRSYPESNGRRNWTAMFKRVDSFKGLVGTSGGITIAQGEYWNRVAYEAERARVLLGLRDSEPWILEYGDDVGTPEEWTGYDKDAAHGVNMDKPKPERG